MERIKVFAVGVLLLLPFFVCLISNSLVLMFLGTIYLAAICKCVPKKFWKRFLWVNARICRMFEGGK